MKKIKEKHEKNMDLSKRYAQLKLVILIQQNVVHTVQNLLKETEYLQPESWHRICDDLKEIVAHKCTMSRSLDILRESKMRVGMYDYVVHGSSQYALQLQLIAYHLCLDLSNDIRFQIARGLCTTELSKVVFSELLDTIERLLPCLNIRTPLSEIHTGLIQARQKYGARIYHKTLASLRIEFGQEAFPLFLCKFVSCANKQQTELRQITDSFCFLNADNQEMEPAFLAPHESQYFQMFTSVFRYCTCRKFKFDFSFTELDNDEDCLYCEESDCCEFAMKYERLCTMCLEKHYGIVKT
jgi:hypothetical protein